MDSVQQSIYFRLKVLFNLLVDVGVQYVILCPGSRSAPLAITAMRTKGIKTITVVDERSAGFIALGISQRTNSVVPIICTSGTAVYNLAPSCAEAFFSGVPLMFLTADRPSQWIGQQDNQAIYQAGIFGKNVGRSYDILSDRFDEDSIWMDIRNFKQGVQYCKEISSPVHFNFPFAEPFYPTKEDEALLEKDQDIENKNLVRNEFNQVPNYFKLNTNLKVVYLLGYHPTMSSGLKEHKLNNKKEINNILITESLNINEFMNQAISAHLLGEELPEHLIPDILITCGYGMVSKRIKNLLRKYKTVKHYHFTQNNEEYVDTFRLNAEMILASVDAFMQLSGELSHTPEYSKAWWTYIEKRHKKYNGFVQLNDKTELKIINNICSQLKKYDYLYLGNSNTVRQVIEFPSDCLAGLSGVDNGIYCNRGTSGIDGTLSSAVGGFLQNPERPVVCILGDLSFMYDRNALWSLPEKNCRFIVIVINNNGGGIFKEVAGANVQPELKDYFMASHSNNFEHTALQHGFEYHLISEYEQAVQLKINKEDASYYKKFIEINTSNMDLKLLSQSIKDWLKYADQE